MHQVEISKAQAHLPELVAAALQGDIVILTTNGQQVRLVPLGRHKSSANRHFGSAKGKIWMAEDFDAPLEDFREYME